MEKSKLKLYQVSADRGNSWTEQWLTEDEVKNMIEKYKYIIKEANNMNEYYVITSLMINQEDIEVNVLGLAKSEQEAIQFADQKVQEAVEMYEENDMAYDIEEDDYSKTIYRADGEETIKIEWQRGEVI